MKDITRIHIAKVPYSIEIPAKKELESYIEALKTYTTDDELLQDIEIRITELLLEREIKQEQVITFDDVAAIRKQLGEPKEFMTDEAAEDLSTEALTQEGIRKLYRDPDVAIIGGVLAGIANYIRVDVLWVRVAFIVLMFVSGGFFAVLYAVAWAIVPPARTAAEKLQMLGKPVTLASIRELNESDISGNGERHMAITKRIATSILGLSAVGIAVSAIAMLVVVAAQLLLGQDLGEIEPYTVPIVLMFISGVLLVALSLLVAVASFAQKFSKRIWISALIITVLGITTFTSAITIGTVQESIEHEARQRNMLTTTTSLPESFTSATKLIVNTPEHTSLTYVVDNSAPKIEQRLVKHAPRATVAVENGVATVLLKNDPKHLEGDTSITITGPALKGITVKHGYVTYESASQEQLAVDVSNGSSVSLNDSRVDTLQATLNKNAYLDTESSSVFQAELILNGNVSANLATIKSLLVKSQEACATNQIATVSVRNIQSATFDYNGSQAGSRSMQTSCFELTVGDDDELSD